MMTLNHGFSGYVCGRVMLPLLKRRSPLSPRAMGWAFFLGAMLPDLDIQARLLGRGAYFSGAWYAHRGASHSILGTLLLAMVAAVLLYRPLCPAPAEAGGSSRSRNLAWLTGCLWCAGLLHVFGDLFTPGLPMPLLWPLEPRLGALGHIGWFTPYLLWLFLATLALDWGARAVKRWVFPAWHWMGAAVWALYALAGFRWVEFLLTSRYESWSQWQARQQALLPEAMIAPVSDAVGFLWHWFTR
jgi:membrane-bound metal-dependent hydrolase YbcI (DUF457 family)